MPRLPKPKPLRQNTERRDIGLVALDGGLPAAPPPPAGWLKETKAVWAAYWASPLAQTALPGVDGPVLERLFTFKDLQVRLIRIVKAQPAVPGSMGQVRGHPLWAQIEALETSIVRLEDRFGLSARGRLQLGVQLGDAVRSLADIAQEFAGDDDAEAANLLLAFAGPAPAVDGADGHPLDGGQPRPRSRRRTG